MSIENPKIEKINYMDFLIWIFYAKFRQYGNIFRDFRDATIRVRTVPAMFKAGTNSQYEG